MHEIDWWLHDRPHLIHRSRSTISPLVQHLSSTTGLNRTASTPYLSAWTDETGVVLGVILKLTVFYCTRKYNCSSILDLIGPHDAAPSQALLDFMIYLAEPHHDATTSLTRPSAELHPWPHRFRALHMRTFFINSVCSAILFPKSFLQMNY